MPDARRGAPLHDPFARRLATATIAWASVAIGVAIVSPLLRWHEEGWEMAWSTTACAASTLVLTLALASSYLHRPRARVWLAFSTLLAAGANATICATIVFGFGATWTAMSAGVVVWGPVGLAYFVAFAIFVRALRSIERAPSRDLRRRYATVAGAWLTALLFVGSLLPEWSAVVRLSVASMTLPVLALSLGTVAVDLRDLAFLRRVARGLDPRLAIEAFSADEERDPLVPFVAGLGAPEPRWVLVETSRAGEGPFRALEARRRRYSIADRARPLRRRVTLCLVLAFLAGGAAVRAAAFLVQPYVVATLFGS